MARVKAPACQNPKCEGLSMLRAYVRPACPDGKQRLHVIGWWCPMCGGFMNE